MNNGKSFSNASELDDLIIGNKFCFLYDMDKDGVILAKEYDSHISSRVVFTGKEYEIKLWD